MEAVRSFFIGGEWARPSRTGAIAVINPAAEQRIATVPRGAAADARHAVHAARWAFDEGPWPRLRPAERATLLQRFAVEATIDRPSLIELAVDECGVPIAVADAVAITPALDAFSWYAARAARDVESRLPDHGATSSTIVRDPVGVVAVIAAAAEPLASIVHKAVPALAAGNTVVVKAPSGAPMTAFVLARCAQRAGLPPGVFNVVSGPGRDVGVELATNSMVDVVALAGRISTGRRVAASAAATVKTSVLTLGSTGTAIVLDGADTAEAASAIIAATLSHAGQSWGAPCRILATPSVREPMVDALAHEIKGLVVGDPADPATGVGPVRSAAARERAESMMREAVGAGATLVTGGGRPDHLPSGFFLEPALLTGVEPTMPIAVREIAAPALIVLAVDDDEQAIRVANDRLDGVFAMVRGASRDHALRVARRIRAGTVAAQGAGPNPWAPAGGYGHAGLGRERGIAGLDAYTEVKHVAGPAS